MIIGLLIMAALVVTVGVAIGGQMTNSAASTANTDATGAPIDLSSNVQNAFENAEPLSTSQENGADIDVTEWQNGAQVTTDQTTWPSGDAIWDICRAIAVAEGYNVGNSVPFRLNNPGDISDGASQFGSESHSGSNVTTFPDAATGWNWLYQKISNHVNGKSTVYPSSMTIDQFAKKYAGNWQNWEKIVCQQLGVTPDQTFAGYVNG